ncbi:MAG TPA: hypothetical protein VFB21_06605 [Chthonomonadaceae bacterium]|nr:hypothetical protein [Chthonomonadaceae bacterium]
MDATTEQAIIPEDIQISEEVQEEAKSLIKEAFQLFDNQMKNMAADLAEFNRKRQEVRERIQRGARRTTGRIV